MGETTTCLEYFLISNLNSQSWSFKLPESKIFVNSLIIRTFVPKSGQSFKIRWQQMHHAHFLFCFFDELYLYNDYKTLSY